MSSKQKDSSIHQQAFKVSAITLFTLCLLSVAGRLYVRVRVQKQFGVDDGFLLFGTACLIAGTVLILPLLDPMYKILAFAFNPSSNAPPAITEVYYYNTNLTVCLALMWCTEIAAKFCFLFLFRKLIDRMKRMIMYWYFVISFNAVVGVCGIIAVIMTCPHFSTPAVLTCSSAAGRTRGIKLGTARCILDVAGDLLILSIPARLIYKIRVRFSQKLLLALTLCLTVFIILFTVVGMAGVHPGQPLDFVWITYWNYVTASTALMMTSMTAFRSLFVAHQQQQQQQGVGGSSSGSAGVYSSAKRALKRAFTLRSMRGSYVRERSCERGWEEERGGMPLPGIERGTITGLRSFVNGCEGKGGKLRESRVMRSQGWEEEEEEEDGKVDTSWPLGEEESVANVPAVGAKAGGESPVSERAVLTEPERVRKDPPSRFSRY